LKSFSTGDRLITCKKNGGNMSELLRLKENRVRQEIYKEHLKEAKRSPMQPIITALKPQDLAVTTPKRRSFGFLVNR
jgi:hypothetical protein